MEALASSQRLGMLGRRPIEEVVDHAQAFVTALADVDGLVVDLGSGGGVPGLVIAAARPDLRVVLVDRRTTRADHLRRLVGRLGWLGRVDVVAADVSALRGREPADAAVARGFGPPLVTLSAAVPLVRAGGLIVVSEPPDEDSARWPVHEVAALGAVAAATPDRRVACFTVRRPV